MIIQHNIMALNSYNRLANNNSLVSKNIEKLSSGYKINRAGDDAAGLAISEKMRAQITGLERATQNAQDGISLVQTAEGNLTEVHSMLNRMVDLATQSSNGTYDVGVDRKNLQTEMEALKAEIDRIAETSNFNGIKLLDGSLGGVSVSSKGSTLTGGSVAKFTAANTGALAGIKADLSGANAVAAKETYSIDGQVLTIDWTKGDAKKVFDSVNVDLSAATASQLEDIAAKMTTLFNDEMKAQGLSGEIKVTNNTDASLTFASLDKSAKSEFTFVGTSHAAAPEDSLGSKIFGSTKGETKAFVAGQVYNGPTIAGGSKFHMNINGKDVAVSIGAATPITQGTTTIAQAATILQTAVQDAVTAYNTLMGYTGTDKALTNTDFTVAAKDGALQIKYGGNQKDVSFSFSDIDDNSFARNLGIASGGSSGSGGSGLSLQIGDTAEQRVSVNIDAMSTAALGLSSVDVSTEPGATKSMKIVKDAINTVSTQRAKLGAVQNRLEHTINNLTTSAENMTSAEARIRDTDMAKEMMQFTKNNVLAQAAQAMLAQANQQPQQVLQLLR